MSDREHATLATSWIGSSRLTGIVVSDEDNVKRAGFRNMNEYWQMELSAPMSIPSLIHLLATHFFEPTLIEGGPKYKGDLRASIQYAIDVGKVTRLEIPGRDALVRPRQVVKYLLATPDEEQARLVPETLRAFIEGTNSATPKKRSVKIPRGHNRRTGSPPVKREQAKANLLHALQTGEITPDELSEMPDKTVRQRYGHDAGRTTVRDAVKSVLSEFETATNSDKHQTNDK